MPNIGSSLKPNIYIQSLEAFGLLEILHVYVLTLDCGVCMGEQRGRCWDNNGSLGS